MILATAEPMPHLPIKVQLERSHFLLEIEDRAAQVNTLKALQQARRASMIAMIGELAYQAERAKYGLEQNGWQTVEGNFLDLAIENARNAISAYDDGANTIRYQEMRIEDMQRTLNDVEAWDDDSTRQLEARRAARRG